MNKVLMPVFYLPPISWFAHFLDENSEIVFEQFEHFPKQTFRNRANIYGANGKLSLIIPIRHNGERVLKNIQVSDAENWRALHWKSIKTAYQSTPYFEFYEDKLEKIFQNKEKSLLKFNLDALNTILEILKADKAYSLNNEYVEKPEEKDMRKSFDAKKTSTAETEVYWQPFCEKYGFLADLSVLDLLCNKGPESYHFIKKISTSQKI